MLSHSRKPEFTKGKLVAIAIGLFLVWLLRTFPDVMGPVFLTLLAGAAILFVFLIVIAANENQPSEIAKRAKEERNKPLADGETEDDRIRSLFEYMMRNRWKSLASEYVAMLETGGVDHYHRLLSEELLESLVPKLPDYLQEYAVGIISGRDEVFMRLFVEPIKEKATELRTAYRDPNMTPLQFESWCSRIISGCGWVASTTKASGDQGADVIARLGDMSAVVQCKRYSKPVGNKAVQEAISARAYYHANEAIVVSTSGFTKSAEELASVTGVHLVPADRLGLFWAKVMSPNVPAHADKSAPVGLNTGSSEPSTPVFKWGYVDPDKDLVRRAKVIRSKRARTERRRLRRQQKATERKSSTN